MMDVEKKKLVVAGLTTRLSSSSSPSPSPSPPPSAGGVATTGMGVLFFPAPTPPVVSPSHSVQNLMVTYINESEGGDHTAEFREKKGRKAKTLRWISSNSDMNNGNGDAEGSDGNCDDTVLSSLTTAPSFGSLISRKRVRTLGKVDEDSDAVDPPVPRKLRSAINKRSSRTPSSSPQHVKKRRHLSAISAQIFLMDRATRFKESSSSNSLTEEEEVLADTLLSLSQIPAPIEPTADRATEKDISNTNVASTSCSEGVITHSPTGAVKEDDKITVLPSAANEVVTQPAHSDQQVEQTISIPQVNPALGSPQDIINLDLPIDGQTQDLSLTLDVNSLSTPKDLSNNSALKQLKVQQYDDSLANPAKTEAPHWLVNCSKPGFVKHDRKKGGNDSAQETVPLVPTPPPCTSNGSSTKPSSSMFGARTNTATETAKASATGSNGKISLVKNDDATKTWKKSITHVYVSHLIQTHLNKEKASQNRVKPDERSNSRTLRPANGSTLNKSAAHFDVRLPVQPSTGIWDTACGQKKMVGSSYLNLPIPAAASGAHVQYLHPQMTHHGVIPMQQPYQHLPYSRGNLASAMALQQHMQQYMHNPGCTAHPGIPGPSQGIMKLQQFVPTPQQQQQMWQFHLSQYQHPRPDAAASAPMVSWQNSRLQQGMSSSLRPIPPSSAIMPPQMELLCAPYQGGGGGSRRPALQQQQQQQHLRLI